MEGDAGDLEKFAPPPFLNYEGLGHIYVGLERTSDGEKLKQREREREKGNRGD